MRFYWKQKKKPTKRPAFRGINKHFSRVYQVLTLSELVIYSCDLGKQSRWSI